ncbi:gamma-glutamyl-gamma-aminobutyrate hydrolase family protein [Thermoleophilum album]|uniref:Putative glutamine amidotransferase n=1 Tax=Thermoleophilum album TaxID=29539 RepID=A0A1H6FIA0_THEAL|nr:gamma-glutamyl-gamma-aminobutyrate hydrolase family protein [Thermoleophilum album]SEH10561.1 putative glutamine amidotransferase [Thermoleophilum album]
MTRHTAGRRPIIGITGAIERARWSVWQAEAAVVARTYIDQVRDAGGMPILLPPDDESALAPEYLLEHLDGLVLTGGLDLDPASYGARPHQATITGDGERDRFELALCYAAVEADLPVLGICRGVQVLNVALGGTLIQHVPDVVGDERHLPELGTYGSHEVELVAGSLVARTIGAERIVVHSHHHQAVDELGDGLVAVGRSLPDGIVEAIEVPERDFVCGVQWHTEEERPFSPLLRELVERARARLAERAAAAEGAFSEGV